MKYFGLIGSNVNSSRSPFIHKVIMEELGVEADYKVFETKDLDLAQIKGLDGVSITMPYKERIVEHLNWLNISSAVFNVVNTVKKTKDGLTGFNTDIYGFNKAIARDNIDLEDVLIIGCGGLAKSLTYDLLYRAKHITVLYREGSSHINDFKDLFSELEANVEYTTKADKQYSCIINAAPYNSDTTYDISNDAIKTSKYVFDANYKNESSLIKVAKENAVKHQDGLDMLIYQAIKQEEIWNSLTLEESEIDRIFKKVKESL